MWIGALAPFFCYDRREVLPSMEITPPVPRSAPRPSNEAALEVLGVERREDVAEVIVQRRAIAKWPEPAQKRQLLGAEAGDIDQGLHRGQYREQAHQQHLVEQIGH